MACKRMVNGMNKEMAVCQMPEKSRTQASHQACDESGPIRYRSGNHAFVIIPKANVNQWPGYSFGVDLLFDFLGIWKSSRKAGD